MVEQLNLSHSQSHSQMQACSHGRRFQSRIISRQIILFVGYTHPGLSGQLIFFGRFASEATCVDTSARFETLLYEFLYQFPLQGIGYFSIIGFFTAVG